MFLEYFIKIGETIKIQNFTDLLNADIIAVMEHLACFVDFKIVDVLSLKHFVNHFLIDLIKTKLQCIGFSQCQVMYFNIIRSAFQVIT